MESQLEENKRLALGWFQTLAQGGVAAVEDLAHPECRFFIAGDMPICGWFDKPDFLKWLANAASIYRFSGPPRMEFGHIIAEGDWVFLEIEVHVDLEEGKHYNNQIGFMLRFRDGKLIEHKEYTDTLHVYRVMEHEAIRGAPIPRQSNLTTTSAVVSFPGG